MKKALALVLALVLALSLGVSAFALTVVDLEKAPSTPTSKTEIKTLEYYTDPDGAIMSTKYYRADAEGGDYYFELNAPDYEKLKNIEVTVNGPIAGSIVEYDSDTMTGHGSLVWEVVDKDGTVWTYNNATEKEKEAYDELAAEEKYVTKPDGYNFECVKAYSTYKVGDVRKSNGLEGRLDNKTKLSLSSGGMSNYTELGLFEFYFTSDDEKAKATKGDFAKAVKATIDDLASTVNSNYANWTIYEVKVFDNTTEAFNKALATALNDVNRNGNLYHADSTDRVEGEKLLKITVDPNYSASYKIGTFVVEATAVNYDDATGKVSETKKVSYTGKVVSDVVIFEYEEVKWAAKKEIALTVGENGYSAYYYDGNYGTNYNYEALRQHENATVISTTAFRAIRENEQSISVKAGYMTVDIPEVGTTQKGVNFAYDQGNGRNRISNNGIVKVYNAAYLSKGVKVPEAIEFGFLGDQVIASDFTVTVDLDMNAYELREFFGEAVEEEDIITYYIVENGKVVGQVTYDYMKDNIDENIELEIKRKAGETLGHYSIVLEAPSAAPEGEENPNTGAESVIGVVAAMAVVSLAAAAAVSLKK